MAHTRIHSHVCTHLCTGDRGRSKKWKEMLKLPPVAQCLCLKEDIGMDPILSLLLLPHVLMFPSPDHTFEYLVEEQPIGGRLFHMYCSKDVELSKCVKVIEALDDFLLVAAEKRAPTAHLIFDEFVSQEVFVAQ